MPGIKSLGDMPIVEVGGTFGPNCTTYYEGELVGLMPLESWTEWGATITMNLVACFPFVQKDGNWKPQGLPIVLTAENRVTPL